MRGTLRTSFVQLAAAPAAALAVALAAGACSSAGGDVSGGTARFDSTAAAPSCAITEPDLTAAGDTTWRGIYRDYFGCRSKSSCAGSGACHDTATSPGTRQSNFICASVDECYKTLTTSKSPDKRFPNALVEPKDVASPEAAYLFSVITFRTRDGTLVPNRGMPQLPRDFAYTPDDIARMQAWIRNGAKND